MDFVKLDPALTRAEPDLWLALPAAGFHEKYLADAEDHRTWRGCRRWCRRYAAPACPYPSRILWYWTNRTRKSM